MRLVSVILMISFQILAQEKSKISFDDLPRLIKERNEHYKGARSFLRAAESQTGHLGRSYLPILTAEAGGESFKRGQHSQMSQPYGAVTAKVNIFRGGKDLLEEEIKEQQVVLSQAQTEEAYIDELTKARRVFWNLVYQKEMLKILIDAKEHNQKNLQAANKRIRAGAATETDRIEFEMENTKLNEDITRLSLGVKSSQRELSILIGLSENAQIDTAEHVPHQHDDAILKTEFKSHAHRDIKAGLAKYDISDSKRVQSYRWWMPSLDVYGSYGLHTFREIETLEQNDRYETVVGAKLTFEIFDGFQAKTQGSTQALEAEGFRAQANQTARELKARFESSKEELRLTHELIHSAEKSIEQGKKYLGRTLSEYSRGVKNSPDVLGANQRFTDYQRRAIELKRDYQLAKIQLLAILGQ